MGVETLAPQGRPARRPRWRRRLVGLAAAIGCLFAAVAAQERPLPDLQPFLAQARTRLQTDNERQRSYIYVETQRRMKLDESGRARSESVKVVESYPALPGEDERIYIVAFLPMGRAALGERNDLTSTSQYADASKSAMSNSTLVSPP